MDLADQIDDYICSFEGLGDLTMDSLAIFIFIWGVLSLFLVWLCKFLYNKYMLKEKAPSQANSRQGSVVPGAKIEKRLSEPREILASKTDNKDLTAKPAGVRGRSGSGAGAIGGARRRMVRQSSAGPENRKKRYVPPPSNVVGPETTSVTWTSQVFRWLYSDLVIVNELLITWVIALNESLKSSLEKHGIAVEIVRVLPDSPPPALSNIFCNCDENNPADMLITYDCDAMPVLQVKTFRQRAGKVETSHYKVTVSRLRARIAAAMNYNTLKGDMRIEGYPDVRIAMNSVGAIKPMDQDEQQLQELISEILSSAIRDTVYPVDFSMYSTCPRGELELLDTPVIYPVHYDALAHNMEQHHLSSHGVQSMVSGRRLLVKIVKGDGLQNAVDPYVVVEMDEPAQKNQTGARAGTNPYWDEHFLFELAPNSAEILFEVYDRASNNSEEPKFLGLGLVGIDELAVGPASTQKLSLQPRPYENQQVYGSITVDFVFIEGAEVPADIQQHKMKEALRLSSLAINEHIKNGSDLADAAVRALQEGTFSSNGQPSKSTLIIHSVQRVEINKDGKIEMTEAVEEAKDEGSITPTPTASKSLITNEEDEVEAKIHETSLATDITASPTDSYPNEDALANSGNNSSMLEASASEFGQPIAASSPNGHNNYTFNGASNINSTSYNGSNTLNSNTNNTYSSSGYQTSSLPRNGTTVNSSIDAELDDRGRSKKRNFFGTLKKRLGRSKTRTLSADFVAQNKDGTNNNDTNTNNTTTPTSSATKGTLNGDSRSLSVDRAVMSKNKSFGSRSPGLVNHSRRSSISESSAISGFSSASTKTYIHEASTLVLETIENGIKRHFIVPLAIAQRPKWRRKGTKLHIYNDHTFIAKHLSGGGLQCSICMKSIPRRPGKQGYECRDCQLICHKQCHVRAPQACPNPTVLSMELNTFPVLTEADLH